MNEYLVRNGTLQSDEDLRNIVRKIVDLGEKLDKPVCATCDVHFMDPQDEIYRRICKQDRATMMQICKHHFT